MPDAKILLVDDEPGIIHVMSTFFKQASYDVASAGTGEEALDILKSESIHLILLDLRLAGGVDGLEVMRSVKREWPNLPIIMVTAYGTVEVAVQAMKEGAYEFICKPVDFGKLLSIVEKALDEKKPAEQDFDTALHYGSLVGESSPMQKVYQLIEKVADSDAPVLIEGESGTGKELVAHAIHNYSARRKAPWVPLNCGAIPENLLESELFGHVPGAFTGASQDRNGLFIAADQGTLFLDELAVLNSNLQAKLLRVLQDYKIRRLGENRDIPVDIRLIAATNVSLENKVKEGAFREDLYYRISVIPIRIPPLRERPEDIPALTDYFCRQQTEVQNTTIDVAEGVMEILQNYDWPGNGRELQNAIACAATLCQNGTIRLEDLPPSVKESHQDASDVSLSSDSSFSEDDLDKSLHDFLREKEQRYIEKVLEKTGGNRAKAAEWLGVSRATFYRKYDK